MFLECSGWGIVLHSHYICLNTTPNNTSSKSSLQSSLRKLLNSKAIQKMISLRSGVKMGYGKRNSNISYHRKNELGLIYDISIKD